MLCCLNPACHNPSLLDDTKFCFNCGVPLVMLRNRYRPIKSLGGGGFSKTYLAEDIDKLNEKCVIKQFVPQVQGTAGLKKATELFEQEAKRLQQLGEHPQIPTLLAYFKENGQLYLMQQFIDGQNLLDRLLQQGTFNEEKIRDLLQDLLNILKVVHQQKVIHRDIKPENIIQRGDGKVVLIDFGTSKQLTKTVMTGQGTMIGSFGYASLEQMQGGEAYPTSDLYSLGVTCFHLLSGIHPWEFWKSQGYGWVDSWRKHLQQPVSQELGKIIDKLLQIDYQQRYQSVGEVLQDLNLPLQPTRTGNAKHYYTRGIEHYTRQDLNGAIENFNQAIQINPNYAQAYDYRGHAHYYLRDYQEAIEDYTQSIQINPNNAQVYNYRGHAHYNLGDYQEAIKDYTQAIQINPNDAITYNSRGYTHYYLDDYQAAIEDYDQAIQIDPNYSQVYNRRGNAHFDLGDYQEAIEDYNKAIQINPNDAIDYSNRGTIHCHLGNYQEAIEDYTQAIKINSDNAISYSNRGRTHYDLGNYQEAIEDYNQAIKINPDYARAYYNRGNTLYDLRDYQAAIEDYNQAIKINPDDAKAYHNRGNILCDLGGYQAAIKDLNQAIRINPDYAEAYNNRGFIYYELGDYQEAIEDFTQAIRINPNYAEAYKNRGYTHHKLGDKKAAIEDFRKAVDLYAERRKTKRKSRCIKPH